MQIGNMETLFSFIKIGAVTMIVTGISLNYLISKRRFKRRTWMGMQVFRNYEHAWITRLIERIIRVIAFLLIITGMLLLAGTFLPAGQ